MYFSPTNHVPSLYDNLVDKKFPNVTNHVPSLYDNLDDKKFPNVRTLPSL